MKFRGLLALTLVALSLPLCAGAEAEIGARTEVQAEGFTRIRSLQGITEYRLESNGLTVLLLPEHSTPSVTFMVTYRIGSRNESYGTTGATHLLEHLMFKGTTRHNKEAGTGYDQVLERTGAQVNATTWLDRTNYFATLGPQDLPLVVELEADRMRNLRLREEDRQPEMTVVRNEFERGENDPALALDTEIWATAYLAHPYHHSVIGWRSDVEHVPIEKLRAFYDTYYWPDNATVSVIGDFKPEATLAMIWQHYGAIPRAPHPMPALYTEEPPQTGPRRVVMKRPGELGVVTISHKSPPARDADYPALAVLCDILATGRNSRFHIALTDPGLTTEVSAYPNFAHDASLLTISAEVTPEATHPQVEERLLAVLAEVREKGVTEAETAAAISRLTAQSAFARDGSFAIAAALNECIAVGDWTLYFTQDEAVKKVTAAEVRRVAKRWLVDDRSTTGWFIAQPQKEEEEEEKEEEEKDAPALTNAAEEEKSDSARPAPATPDPDPAPSAAPLPEIPPSPPVEVAQIAPRVVRSRSGGWDLLVCPTGVKDVVTLTGGMPAADPARPELAAFVAGMLERGTEQRDAAGIAAQLDEVGATLEFTAREGTLDFTARCLRKDLPRVLSLLAEQLRTPAFPPQEIEKLRLQMIAASTQSRADTTSQAAVAFSRAAFPAGHPNRQLTADETIAALKAITREDLLAFQREWLGPAAAVMVAAGDVDPAACQQEVARVFAGWSGGRTSAASAPAPALGKELDLTVPIAGKESITVILGQPSGLAFRDPDALPLSLATAALGEGFTSRLLGTVRDAEGLTYGIGAMMMGDTRADGMWSIMATFAPSLVDRGLASTRRELANWYRDGLTPAEFAYRQSALIGSHRVGLATTEGLAQTLLATVRRGLPLSWLDDYPASVRALTREQVNDVVRRRLDPARMVVVKCGTLP